MDGPWKVESAGVAAVTLQQQARGSFPVSHMSQIVVLAD